MPPERFALLRRVLTGRLITALLQLFNGLGSWHRPDAQRFAAQAIPMVEGAQTALANLTSTYVASVASQALRTTVAPPAIPRGARLRLREVDPQEVYERPFVEAYTALGDGKPLNEALGRARVRLREVAEGDMQQTYAESSRAAMQNLREDQRPSGWRRVLQGDESCALCTIASTQSYTISDLNPIHPNCVPGSSWVRARYISGATRRRYTGKLTIITTSNGDNVAVTPEHPILTDTGWVPAGKVREGHYLIRSFGGKRVAGSGPYESDTPMLAEDVWGSLAVTFGFSQMPFTAEDFHGNGADGEVDVVRADGYFSTVGDQLRGQETRERLFVPGQRWGVPLPFTGSPAEFIPAGVSPTYSVVSSGSLPGAFLSGHLGGSHTAGFRWPSGVDTSLFQPSTDDVPPHPLLVRDDVLSKAPGDVVGAELLRRVTDVHRVDFSGHVFNFHTEFGTYEADSHIVHNCDCIVQPIYGPIEDRVIDPELLEKVHDAVFELTGVRDRGGRAVDYRKILISMTHDHGELGPMLARPQDRFTTVADLPARRS